VSYFNDRLGLFRAFTPKFVKKYENLAGQTTQTMENHAKDVKASRYPDEEHAYQQLRIENPILDKQVIGRGTGVIRPFPNLQIFSRQHGV